MIGKHVASAHRRWEFWSNSDHSLAALLLFLVLYVFVLYPLTGTEESFDTVAALSFSIVVILGVMATTKRKSVRFGMAVLAAIAFLSHWLHYFFGGHTAHSIAAVAAVLFFSAQTWFLLVRVFRGGSITLYRILGAMAAYLLFGLIWGELYILIYLVDPSTFHFSPETQAGEPPASEMFYLSFTTLTTLGLGDILPVHPFARSMVTLEAFIGQLYPSVLLARLVTLYDK